MFSCMAQLLGMIIMNKKVGIIGGGPAGIFCALQIKKINKEIDVTVFEKNTPLKTLLYTGGGRCNLSYNEFDTRELVKNYPRGEKFLYSIFYNFSVLNTLEYFKSIGVETYVQEDNRIFPKLNSAKDVREKMLKEARKYNIKIVKKEIKTLDEIKDFDNVVIAFGGSSNYKLVKDIGHKIKPLAPSLHGYITKEKYLSGITLNINGDNLLFTHEGISGPYVYKHSSINAYEKYPRFLEIPLINLDDLREEIKKNPKKSFGNVVSNFIPKSLAKLLVEDFEKQSAHVKKEEIEKLESLSFNIISADNKGEIVKAGGVDLKEIDKNCKSKINDKFYFIGEALDIDGFTGGFNLQNCWSTGYTVAFDIANFS